MSRVGIGKKGRAILQALGDEELDAKQIQERLERIGWDMHASAISQFIRHRLEGNLIEVTRSYGSNYKRPMNLFKAIWKGMEA